MRGSAGRHELGHGGAGGWEVEVAECLHAGGELLTGAEGGREGFFGMLIGFGEVFEDSPEDAADASGGEFAACGSFAGEGFVDGDDAAHLEEDEFGVFSGGVGVGEDFKGGLD